MCVCVCACMRVYAMLCVLIVCVASACIVRADGVHLGMRVNALPPSVHLRVRQTCALWVCMDAMQA